MLNKFSTWVEASGTHAGIGARAHSAVEESNSVAVPDLQRLDADRHHEVRSDAAKCNNS